MIILRYIFSPNAFYRPGRPHKSLPSATPLVLRVMVFFLNASEGRHVAY